MTADVCVPWVRNWLAAPVKVQPMPGNSIILMTVQNHLCGEVATPTCKSKFVCIARTFFAKGVLSLIASSSPCPRLPQLPQATYACGVVGGGCFLRNRMRRTPCLTNALAAELRPSFVSSTILFLL